MDQKYWKQFVSSGRIEDYLTFVSSQKEGTDTAGRTGEEVHAGIGNGDRNYIETAPCGGVRQTYQPFD